MKDIIPILTKNLNEADKIITFMQIGANCGNDDFTQLCKIYNPQNIILVEPHDRYINSLNVCYKGLNYNIENVAIVTDEDIKNVTLYFPDCEQQRGQHSTLIPMKDWGAGHPVYNIKATTFNKLVKKYNIHKIDLLMIDTEGLDYSIINSIDFNNIKINHIVYESWKFITEKCYDNEHQELFGINGLNYINKKLTTLGYTIINDSEDYYAYTK